MKLYLIALLVLTALVLPSFAQENGATGDATVQESDLGGGGDGSNGSTTGDEPQESPEDKPEQEVQEEQEQDEEDNEEPQEDVKPEDMPAELRDEAEKVKRGVPQISVRSCRILKKYGYCRNAGIARFCISTCRPCVDRLSRGSCHLLKTKYKQCRHHTGRFYCRKTCGHCGQKPLPLQCKRYKSINDITRRQSNGDKKAPRKCDSKLPVRWYRFVGAQGTNMPTKPTKPWHCGTHASGYVIGSLPKIRGLTVSREVCFSWSGKNCYNARWWKVYIKITNCGHYNVYYLTRPRACHYRYCGNL
ncbi:uromodulin [Exaiptasia diaphana]|uniref:UMOD/GP2/OIT3-like D8C domain-containing protein n=1 Tax=Exaiptasia diaphana TaxID=2652724 RepID=A0A913XCB0_EXADI|nr:uromodulin [Exaiptasia diaphana]KXJ13108.1 Oncoprotein-induced transcript 3 protein [Exaiptasia diaphana]